MQFQILSIILLSWSCNQPALEAPYSADQEQIVDPKKQLVDLPVSINTGLNLSSTVENAVMTIDGCSSGYQVLDTISNGNISLYLYDTSCLASLDSFTLNGVDYTLQGIFKTGAGESSTFVAPSSDTATVTVSSQLSDPIGVDDAISFTISRNVKSSDQQLETGENVVIIEADSTQINEEDGLVTFTVRKVTEANQDELIVDVQITGNVDIGADYITPPASVTIPAGETGATLAITIVDDDIAEASEVINASILASPNYFTYGTAQTMILDTDTDFVSTGQVVYFDQTSVTTSGSAVTGWNDLSGQGNNGTQSTSSARPTLVSGAMNGYAAVSFDGSNDLIRIGDSADLNTGGPYSEKTLILAFQSGVDTNRRQIIYEQGGSTRGLSVYIDNGQVLCNAWNNNNDDGGATTPWAGKFVAYDILDQTNYIVGLRMNQNEGVLDCFVNGAFVGSVTGIGNLFAHSDDIGLGGPNGGTLFHDGSSSVSNTYFEGMIGEFLAYNSGLDDGEFLGILDFLSRKYGYVEPAVTLSVDYDQVMENGGVNPVISVYRNNLGAQDLTINYLVSGTATETIDFELTQGQIVIPAFSLSASETIILVDDGLEEGNETIIFNLQSSPDYIIGSSQLQIDIGDDESFSPSGNVSMWLRADTGLTLNGSQLQGWGDDTGLQSVTQTNTSNQPLVQSGMINGEDAITFDGTNDMMVIANSATTNVSGPYNGKTFAFVVRTGSDITSTQVIYEQGGGSRGMTFYIENGSLYFNAFNFPNDDGGATTPWGSSYASGSIQANTNYYIVGVWDQVTDLMTLSINGSQTQASGLGLLYDHGGAIGLGAVNGAIIVHDGRNIGSGNYFGGSISEVIFYNEAINSVEEMAIQNYFQTKYGL